MKPIPLVDTNFLSTATVRQAYPDLVRAGADLSDFDCYACHEKGKPPTLRYDPNGKLIIPKEHSDIVMGHGKHGRNNNCFNCHNETNLDACCKPAMAAKVNFPTANCYAAVATARPIEDWEAGAHGRTSGYWDRSLGPMDRKICVDCHNPHSPHIPGAANPRPARICCTRSRCRPPNPKSNIDMPDG